MERTKVVIRKLPPNIADADVRELVDSTTAKYNWYSFVQGKISVKRVVHSRCYVNLEDLADIPAFKAAVEGHSFVTDRGAQFRGSVEYAPFQKVPQGKPKRDPREGTLDKDPEYLAFVESLDAQPEALPSAEAAGSSWQRSGQEPPGRHVTALMAYLQDKHSLKKKPPAVVEVPRRAFESKADRKRAERAAARAKQDPERGSSTPRILTKPRMEMDLEEERRPSRRSSKAAASSQGSSAQQEAAAEPAAAVVKREASADDKPVRVRAGFQVYQPKQRASRLGNTDEAAAAGSARSGVPSGAARSGGGADPAKSGGGARGAKSGAAGSAAKSGTSPDTAISGAGKEGDGAADEKRASSSCDKSSRGRRRPPRQSAKASSPSKSAEPG